MVPALNAMTGAAEDRAEALAALRAKIDALDAEMHRQLIERGTVIDALIKTKGTSRAGAAFRPGREADMMRRLVARHRGALPLATVEHIWREIITTFTDMQAPFGVVIDGSADRDRMRDAARFYFGFSVPLATVAGPEAVIARVTEANDLGLIPLEAEAASPWWRSLVGPGRPVIMAILPFIRATERPADLPAFVISPPLADPAPADVRLYAVPSARPAAGDDRVVVIARSATAEGGQSSLVAAPASLDLGTVAAGLDVTAGDVAPVGGVWRGIAIDGPSSMLYQSVADKDATS